MEQDRNTKQKKTENKSRNRNSTWSRSKIVQSNDLRKTWSSTRWVFLGRTKAQESGDLNGSTKSRTHLDQRTPDLPTFPSNTADDSARQPDTHWKSKRNEGETKKIRMIKRNTWQCCTWGFHGASERVAHSQHKQEKSKKRERKERQEIRKKMCATNKYHVNTQRNLASENQPKMREKSEK
jgi:hypothetical protein